MVQGGFGFAAGEHAGDFVDAGFAVDFGDGGDTPKSSSSASGGSLVTTNCASAHEATCAKWVTTMTLRAAGQPCQTFAQFDRGLATHAGVNLVEDEGLVGTRRACRRPPAPRPASVGSVHRPKRFCPSATAATPRTA